MSRELTVEIVMEYAGDVSVEEAEMLLDICHEHRVFDEASLRSVTDKVWNAWIVTAIDKCN